MQQRKSGAVTLLHVLTAGIVKGFGCRPSADPSTRTTGPAFESRQGRKARDWGTRISGRYGDLAGADGYNECLSR